MLIKSGNEKKVSSENDATDDDLFILNDIVRENSMINIRKVAPMPLPLSKPGIIFSTLYGAGPMAGFNIQGVKLIFVFLQGTCVSGGLPGPGTKQLRP
ncbi:hypothetical protein MLD38_023457 [Melastoma candidum]|uniref:Uncharacterized protein n=1 Tax=Melastoma candidum TaxID=119954 RepID=A0ACB9NPT6_9MYRT|nr:hypothetical protein MLD38_023457 [Melastoma candidum]